MEKETTKDDTKHKSSNDEFDREPSTDAGNSSDRGPSDPASQRKVHEASRRERVVAKPRTASGNTDQSALERRRRLSREATQRCRLRARERHTSTVQELEAMRVERDALLEQVKLLKQELQEARAARVAHPERLGLETHLPAPNQYEVVLRRHDSGPVREISSDLVSPIPPHAVLPPPLWNSSRRWADAHQVKSSHAHMDNNAKKTLQASAALSQPPRAPDLQREARTNSRSATTPAHGTLSRPNVALESDGADAHAQTTSRVGTSKKRRGLRIEDLILP
mmetsp:Transcript_2776/g.7635  ORF Transcript_2776/g.7635 Transcript_2776/m.7635 type:complete len:280 (-) Transcript_2776:82-921(-)